MARSLLYKKITCKHCNGGMKRKRERSRNVYICTNYDLRNGKCDVRVPIDEHDVLELVKKRYRTRLKVELTDQEAADKIKYMTVEDKDLFEIELYEFDDTILMSINHIRF